MSCPTPGRMSAYVDGALRPKARERTALHLVACTDCRSRVAELRGLRERVRTSAKPTAAPSRELAARLVQIAGEDATSPLYARPFSARPAERSMPRRTPTRRGALVVGTGFGTLTLILFAVGWLAAPPVRTPAIDPTAVARNEFLAALGAEPLTNPALTAAVAAPPASAIETATAPEAPHTESGPAYDRLRRAETAARSTAYAGTQLVQMRHHKGFWSSRVDVEARPGSGVEVVVNPGTSGAAPRLVPQEATLGVEVVAASHRLTTGPGPIVAGRPTHVVEASDAGGVAGRWWLDVETGLMLWSQAFQDGRLLRSSGFETIQLGAAEGDEQAAPRLTMPVPATSLTLAAVPQMAQNGFACPATAGGFDLLRVREAGGLLHTMYGDGVDTLSVFETPGALGGAPSGTVWDPTLRVYRNQGLPVMLTWQSSDRVFTVITNGDPRVAISAMRELPHEPPVLRTRTERIVDGWRAILAWMGVRG